MRVRDKPYWSCRQKYLSAKQSVLDFNKIFKRTSTESDLAILQLSERSLQRFWWTFEGLLGAQGWIVSPLQLVPNVKISLNPIWFATKYRNQSFLLGARE